jgi:anthranilate phosphoribosyltransferase
MDAFKPLIGKVATGSGLTRAEAELAFDNILSGEVTPAQMGAFLMALRVRGETVDEITGAVTAMRAKMARVNAPADAIDIVGTGGDSAGTYNVSTLASLIVAACGVPVAKHGNRAASSKSGASDVLGALGVAIGVTPASVETCIAEAGIGFMMAQTHHLAMRHVGPVRVELGTRTIFNILGPLSNPAGVKQQLLGAFSLSLLQPMAEVLRNLGSQRVWLVHGSDGLDEMTTTGPTHVVALEHGEIRSFTVTPEDAGLPYARAEDLRGGGPAFNAAALRDVLEGKKSPYRDIALLNAAAALVVAGRADDLRDGVALAAKAVDEGRAKHTLEKLIAVSNRG